MTYRRSSGADASVATLFVIAAILAVGPSTATSRAVNISSTWFLPQEGFPVFYRYFRDRITWFEADAVCQFHHANLVTVDTSVQYDATRAYLKELDIVNNVWIGLKKAGPADEFAWTDGKALSPDGGFWQEQIPKSSSPLCAAVDPAADFRWHSLNCGGPEVASFICEMPVPPWASKDGGCMLTSLPSLTVIFLPELSAIELTSDCGLDGTRRIACKGEADREEMMKQLSCTHGGVTPDDEVGSVSPDVTSSSSATLFSSSAGSPSSGYTISSSSMGSTGTRAWTGHHQTPTRHRREADVDQSASSQMISLIKSTTAVAAETTAHVTTVGTVFEVKKGTDTMSSSDATTSATEGDYSTETTTNLPLELTETATTGSDAATNQDSQLSTMGEKLVQPTAGLAVSTDVPEDEISDGGVFSPFKEMRVIPENSSTQYAKETSTEPITTINVLSPSSQAANTYQMEATATQMPTVAVAVATGTTAGNAVASKVTIVQNSTEAAAKNATENATLPPTARVTVVMATNGQPKTNAGETTAETTTTVPDNNDDVAYLIMQERNQKTSEEINSREEDEEERLKEEERKEKEKRFKEEEENRRRLFLPTPLRNAPDLESESSSKLPVPLMMEDPYEEPSEIIEPEPEVPSRPNRGRRLTRPQTHSFYPYFLNRVLG